jgi:tRNA/tmRNA/rRNA uracil-C5-methylase (TrmA/RlmC/RlmD family)
MDKIEFIKSNEPLTVGHRLAVTIQDIAFGGEGVARADEFVVFVPFVLVGEKVEVEITEVKRRFARARLLTVLQASPERVAPGCRYFGDCGGCQYQHIDYSAQLRLKRKQVADLFQRLGGCTEAVVDPVIPCPEPYGYRNRIMVRSQWDKFKQGLNIGFIRADNRLVVDIEECKIAEPVLNQELLRVRAHPPPKGGIKVVLRLSPEGWEVPRDSFFQNNFHLLPKLVETVRERVRLSGARHLIDVYCGVGFFSIELADLVDSYVGVELDKLAVQAARRNAAARQRTNGEYLMGRAEELLPSLLERFTPEKTVVILDPPRTGCPPESLDLLKRVRSQQVLYVSCHPATLARDIQLLCADGTYRLDRVVPLDMFPQTQHVECVADLRLAAGARSESKAPTREQAPV